MKILVTGMQGQVGTELSRLGAEYGCDIVALNREKLDITSRDKVFSALSTHKPEWVINAAAYTAVDKAETEKETAFAVNRDGPKHLAKACNAEGIPLIHFSTDYVFDGSKQKGYLEDDEVNPLGVYGQSKYQGEQAIRELHKHHIIIRTSWVFSAHGNNFVKTMLRLARQRDELGVVSDQHGCPTAARDIARVALQIAKKIEAGQATWGTYHFCGQPQTTWYEFARKIFEISNIKYNIKSPQINNLSTAEYPTPVKRPAHSVLRCEKIRKDYNITLPAWDVSLNEVLAMLHGTE